MVKRLSGAAGRFHRVLMQRRVGRSALRRVYRLTAGFREDQGGGVESRVEVEHVVQGAGDGIKRSGYALSVEPVVLDKTDDRALIGDAVIHEVLLGPRRDHQQRKPGAIAAPALRMTTAGNSGKSLIGASAGAGSSDHIGAGCRLVYERRHHVIVPAV